MTNNAYDRITERILEMMKEGVCPWRQPWSTKIAPPQNFCTKRQYSGMNFFMLSMSGFRSPYFMTFRQVQEHGGSVKKGSHGFPIIYWSTTEVEADSTKATDHPEAGKGKTKLIPFLRAYTVFNAEQIEDVTFPPHPTTGERHFNPIERAEEIVKGWTNHPEIVHGYPKAYYMGSEDKVYMPYPQDFERPEAYYATLFHELAHATGAPKRLSRTKGLFFGDTEYSQEELVAEMTSAFLCAQCGIDNDVIQNQAAYLDHWTKAIGENRRLVVVAASQAQRAANYMLGITKEVSTPERAKGLANEMKVIEMSREIAEGMRPDYGKEQNEIEIDR
jgi:antirestriction protein ArdC